MEYAKCIDQNDLFNVLKGTVINADTEYSDLIDPSQYVGWGTITEWASLPRQVFTKRTIKIIQQKVYEYLYRSMQKKIVPSEKVVVIALFGVYENHKPNTGDIYGKFLVVDETQRDDYGYIVDKTISLLIDGIRTDIEMADANSKLSIWNTVLGDFNEHGLRQFPPIKLRNKGPDRMLFHMKY
jgi:hypothetical protein